MTTKEIDERSLQNAHHLFESGDVCKIPVGTVMKAKFGKRTVEDGVMNIEKDGVYRVIIESEKFSKRTCMSFLGLHYKLKKNILDWQFCDKEQSVENIVALRCYREEEVQWSKKAVIVPIVTYSDFMVNSVENMTKKEAKEEMKDKSIKKEFTLPTDCLPKIPDAIRKQIDKLKLKKFHE